MRDMLHSEIVQVHGLLNAPDDPELAIAAGTRLCEELLEPLQRIDSYAEPKGRWVAEQVCGRIALEDADREA
jgi:hypothetical protein